ncbi:MAG: hypothetical protein K2Y16_11490 [Burkholderiales bacterium]|nr:hypothetical protein [Burkholderiales bacterium]
MTADQSDPQQILKRPIPRGGEILPAVGLGTWQTSTDCRSAGRITAAQ